MDKDQLNALFRSIEKKRRYRQIFSSIANSAFYWVFDPELDETYRTYNTGYEETARAYRRMKIRYFFSWEGLSKFLLTPVFKIGLTSIVVTPFIASMYIYLREMKILSYYFHYNFPVQMGLLFFSGVFVVIARIFYEFRCPRIVKDYINPSNLDTKNLQKQYWFELELEYCFLHCVYRLVMDDEYILGRLMRKEQENMRKSPEEREIENIPGYSSVVPELTKYRVGFNPYGIWLIENLLLQIAAETKHKLDTFNIY